MNVPIISDVTAINKLEFNGAVRHSDYSNSVGNVTTYAAGLVYEPVKGLGLRAQYQRAIRGPSISELYLGNTVSFDGAIDPCTDSVPLAVGSDLYNLVPRDRRAGSADRSCRSGRARRILRRRAATPT